MYVLLLRRKHIVKKKIDHIYYVDHIDHIYHTDHIDYIHHRDHMDPVEHIDRIVAVVRSSAGSLYIFRVHIQPNKHVLDYTDRTVPTRKHELDHTDLP